MPTIVKQLRLATSAGPRHRRALRKDGPGSRVAAFAQAILGRYGGRARTVAPVGAVFHAGWRPILLRLVRHESHQSFAPRLHLVVSLSPTARAAAASSAAIIPRPRPGREQPRPGMRRPPERALMPAPAGKGSLVHRLEARGTRVEMTRVQPQAPLPALPVPPVTRVLRRHAIVQDEPAPPPRPAPHGLPDNAWPPATGQNRRPETASPLDLKQLTEQVIQAIDQRIIAQRERLGRL